MKEMFQKLVDHLSTDCGEAHRGAFWWDEARRIAVAFGNDGGDMGLEERQEFEVEAVRRLLAEFGGKELEFATASESKGDWALACELPASLNPDHLEGVLWMAWNAASSHRELFRKGINPAPLAHGIEPSVLDWDAIREWLQTGEFPSFADTFTGVQANIARAVLERNGLL